MNRAAALDLARRGELYPSVILHGASSEERVETALQLSRALLCEMEPEQRPCGSCRHCRRTVWPDTEVSRERFHPDFHVLTRDLKTSTSVDATRAFLQPANISPFEARGQVFVVANAETLTAEAANSLLKSLEEPHDTSPRHFFLLTPSRLDLLTTLRSRSLSLYLGPAESVSVEEVADLVDGLATAFTAYARTRSPVYLLVAAQALKGGIRGWEDPRAGRPWTLAAAAVVDLVRNRRVSAGLDRRLLALAEALLKGPALRLRSITPERILEGFLVRYLAGPRGVALGLVRDEIDELYARAFR